VCVCSGRNKKKMMQKLDVIFYLFTYFVNFKKTQPSKSKVSQIKIFYIHI
jgi:hypothetical protein